MIFDPFGDFETRGYLRNITGEKDPAIIRRLEHASFLAGIDKALANLSRSKNLSYRDVLTTHKTLFGNLYPWAGQDRLQTAPKSAVSRGGVYFAHPKDAARAVEHALDQGRQPEKMRASPSEIMGHLAYGHPFLDGNGRTIMLVHAELAQRAGISVNWAETDKDDYLAALTREFDQPGRHLDAYLKPFIGPPLDRTAKLSEHVMQARGLT